MSTPALIRFAQAQAKVRSGLIDPVQELLDSVSALVAEERLKAEQARDVLENLRPVWAQGWTDDSMAAQSSGNALAELWKLLGVDSQTAAVDRLRTLLILA